MSGTWTAPPANTYLTSTPGAGANQREDLYDIITDTSPEETPVFSAIGDARADAINHEWLTDQLQPAGDNKQREGGTFNFADVVPPQRLGNYCQIMSRTVSVSGSMRAVTTVGGDEYERQMIMRGLELRRDIEWRITRPMVKVGNDPREMAGIPLYLLHGSTGAGGALPARNDGTATPTAGTPRDLTLEIIADAKESCFKQGGNPDMGVMTPALKRIFSKLAAIGGNANAVAADNILQTTERRATTYLGAVDVYLTDFGPVEMVPNIFSPAGQMLILDPSFIDMAPLPGRAMVEEDVAKVADATPGVILFEGTVRVRGPHTGAAIYDLREVLPAGASEPPAPAKAKPPAQPAA